MPELSTPTGEDASAPAKPALSICPEGTVLNGLNYFKGKNDPVAKADDQYPEWLWRCLEVQKKDAAEADEEGGDAFCTLKLYPVQVDTWVYY
jgi:large subunit ribosomal protein L54